MTNYWFYDNYGSIDCVESKKKARLECIKAIKNSRMRYNIISTNSFQMEDTSIERICKDGDIWVAIVLKKRTRYGGYAELFKINRDGSLGVKIGSQDW